MHNLIIVGNGFDLAHGLKTSYTDFVKYVIDSRAENPELYGDLLKIPERGYSPGNLKIKFPNYDRLRESPRNEHAGFFKNLFFKKIFEAMGENWCDVEKLYFHELLKNINEYTPNGRIANPIYLNNEFGLIKKELEKYLTLEQQRFQSIAIYEKLFNGIGQASSEDLILNFNYTETVSNYTSGSKNIKHIHIHGELNSEKNPVIFGFAANDKESRELISKEDNEYMQNIKKHNYKRTWNETELIHYLNETENIDVLILGHSCGISDKLILNQIFNHKNVTSIRVFYHETYANYFNALINIDRIMDNDSNFKKLINYSHSHRMPQFSDDKNQNLLFEKYLESHLQYQARDRNSMSYDINF